MNILVVDDEKVEIETLRRGLRSKGHTTLEALNGEDALHMLEDKKNNIGVVITDYLMPNMNGIDLLKSIREKYGALPVIMVTAYGSIKVLTEALQQGCNGFIEKPFNLEKLTTEISRVVKL